MTDQPLTTYLSLMSIIRHRFDAIANTKSSSTEAFLKAETCAFHARKIVEAIAFGCIVAVDNGLKNIPRDVRGQWKADAIFVALDKKSLGSSFPSPSEIRAATEQERQQQNVQQVLEGQPDRKITKEDLNEIYKRLHRWNHEINPYVTASRGDFLNKNEGELWADIDRIFIFISRHFISIGGKGFFSVLIDKVDGTTKVVPLEKEGSVPV